MRIDKRYKWGAPSRLAAKLTAWNGLDHALVRYPFLILAIVFAAWTITMPLSGENQFFFGMVLLLIVMYLRLYSGSFITLMMIAMSIVVSSRYLYWRYSDTLNTTSWLNTTFSSGLFIAELYSWIIMILGFFQSIWPLNRKPVSLPPNPKLWPTVDVLIPTYNEPANVVRKTLITATLMDWPADKLKIYLLDDGRREEFRALAKEVGVEYITREDNFHAKAGNINNALKQISGEYVAIFDCDHMPTRAFLQVSMGGFLTDPKLALVQTPHHFLSPDPYERNLGTFREVPNEGALFYGLVQDGNDLWNAAFFCGSCAILKRSALDEIGGIATETVTEDAHTSLKLHRKGFNSAYLGVTQAAGLATETLSAHVKQRMRWARGMAQIFRVDCPLFGKGLTLAQRFCYTNAIMHFMYGFPRLFFLLSPLAYMFFESYIINAPAGTIAAYALPHIILAMIVNSRIQGTHRQSFWNEAYETSLAWYIMWPVLFALIMPSKGKFNVTAKGGNIDEEFFDWKIGMPYIILFFLNFAGLIIGFLRLFWFNTHEWDTALVNIVWTIYNLVMLSATIAVVLETKQIRKAWRVHREIPAELSVPSGGIVVCKTLDYSEGGVSLIVPESVQLNANDEIDLYLLRGESKYKLPSIVVAQHGKRLRLRFDNLTLEQERGLVAATLSRADAWVNWLKPKEVDHPLQGLFSLFNFSIVGMRRLRAATREGA